ncbi:unnamed protein product [Rotaria socialis]|uniref:Carboxylesterase type B domain-containing protein n=1 Tax=Rotaria socialis TaxID=392032 RepID=A0A818M2F4_9BILA|nr:unnamed protein product [Rotaria socialis]CAF3505073.1 unnamed protein product [Rotaria socialis]CAF3581376.1 unnamed protein product [Rotaria socialis]CAF4258757.1 unnamed protein product [Rotaria socialis]
MYIFNLSFFSSFSSSSSSSTDPLVRSTNSGRVRGFDSHFYTSDSRRLHHVRAWLGIPFAKPPVGQRRFKAPERVEPWSGILDTIHFPATCWQTEQIVYNLEAEKIWSPVTNCSEDCLYLNIWAPVSNIQPTQPMAVLVWIYGGAFVTGSSAIDLYDGRILAATNNVIVVSMQYRLQSLGFLFLDRPDAPGNQGLYDQVLALEWIHHNIVYFDGDSQRITLFGESAGAVAVGFHLLSPRSRALFSNGILESGGPTCTWAYITAQEGRRRSHKYLNEFYSLVTKRLSDEHYRDERDKIPEVCQRGPNVDDVEVMFECATNYPILNEDHYAYITNAEYTIQDGGPMFFLLMPVVDGTFLPQNPLTMLKTGNFKKCPILLGANRDEGSYFMVYAQGNEKTPGNAIPDVSYTTFIKHLELYYNYIPSYPYKTPRIVFQSLIQKYTDWSDWSDNLRNAVILSYAVGDGYFTCPTVTVANAYAMQHMPVYYYHFVARPSTSDWHSWTGVMHGDELMFVFGEPLNATDSKLYKYEEIQLARRIMTYWSNFAKYGNPNGHLSANDSDWPLYAFPERAHVVLDVVNKSTGVAHRADYCAFWENYVPILLEEFERCVIHGPSLALKHEKSSISSRINACLDILLLCMISLHFKRLI